MGTLLESVEFVRLQEVYGRDLVRVQSRMELDRWRQEPGSQDELQPAILAQRVENGLRSRRLAAPRRVLNATGVFLHTNLGRAPLRRLDLERSIGLLNAASDVELDLATGKRGDRNSRFAALLEHLVGAPATLVANNNAAALVLALATHCCGKEVLISRGELVEIGGSFRLPDVLAAAGAVLREVGTTNRTRLADYAGAITDRTAAILRVHPSNFRVRGFVEAAPVPQLQELARCRDLLLIVDEGSGMLLPHAAPQFAAETSVREYLQQGSALVCCSADKLLGGPQAGLLMGRADLVTACRKHPLYRALRPGRLVLTLLDATLRAAVRKETFPLDGLWQPEEVLRGRLEDLARQVGGTVVPAEAFVGGGAAPDEPIRGLALRLAGSDTLHETLRLGDPAVFAYRRDGGLLLDLRTVDPADDGVLAQAISDAQRRIEERVARERLAASEQLGDLPA